MGQWVLHRCGSEVRTVVAATTTATPAAQPARPEPPKALSAVPAGAVEKIWDFLDLKTHGRHSENVQKLVFSKCKFRRF